MPLATLTVPSRTADMASSTECALPVALVMFSASASYTFSPLACSAFISASPAMPARCMLTMLDVSIPMPPSPSSSAAPWRDLTVSVDALTLNPAVARAFMPLTLSARATPDAMEASRISSIAATPLLKLPAM